MRTVRIYCKKCHAKLTEDLVEVEEQNLRWEENVDAIQKNSFSVTTENGRKQCIVALDDYHLVEHPDARRFQGCCGSAGSDGPNKLCMNGHEVATEVSDCWLSHYIGFDLDAITVKEVISGGYHIIIKL